MALLTVAITDPAPAAPIARAERPRLWLQVGLILALTGIVETGVYYREVFLPMACMMKPGETKRLLRGSPMIQVIPILREEWTSSVHEVDAARRAQQQEMFNEDAHFYKEKFWKPMRFM